MLTSYFYTTQLSPHPQSLAHYQNWLAGQHHLPLNYLDQSKIRQNRDALLPSLQSAIVFIFPYTGVVRALQEFLHAQQIPVSPLAAYLFACGGIDYHRALTQELEGFVRNLQTVTTKNVTLNYRIAVDSLPLLEKDLLMMASLGREKIQLGRNSLLYHPQWGSYFLIATLLLDQKIDALESLATPIAPEKQSAYLAACTHCTLCKKICPTGAINPSPLRATLNLTACLNTLLIEQRQLTYLPLQNQEALKAAPWLFGCTRCLDHCPLNRRALENLSTYPQWEELCQTYPMVQKLTNFFLLRSQQEIYQDLMTMSNRQFQNEFGLTGLARLGRRGLMKNIEWQRGDAAANLPELLSIK